MKKVLIITYYWPPAGGAGVQRWLKFVKYLPELGWKPVIFTPKNPEAPANDDSLLNDVPAEAEVIKLPIWEPFDFYKRITGKSPDSKFNAGFLEEEKGNSFMNRLSIWVRGNFFIPDAKRFWISPSAKHLKNYLKDNPVDIIVSTGPPHSLHLIARKLHKKTGIPWVADFRDPWTKIDFYTKLKLSKRADRKHKRLEKKVLAEATSVVVVGNTMAEEFKTIVPRDITVITNGYDKSDGHGVVNHYTHDKYSIVHVGSMNADRNHPVFWEALKSCIDTVEGFENDFELTLVGKNDLTVLDSLNKFGLTPYTNFVKYVPHNEVLSLESQSAVLYLPINDTPNAKGILTGKFFEYLAAKRPVLAVGPSDGDLATILSETKSGKIANFNDFNTLKENIESYYVLFKNKKLVCESSRIEKFERSNLTKQMVSVFEKLI